MKYDQHFLENEEIIKKTIESSKIKKEDIVLEIGPGKGILTKELAKKAKKVIAIEIDKELQQYLKELPKNVEVIYSNALEEIDKIEFDKLIANIPYTISEPLLRKLIKLDFDLAILLISKRFYNLITNLEERKLHTLTNLFFDIEKICEVSKEDFSPQPNVESVLIKLTKKKIENKLLAEIFLQDDKKLKNALIYAFVRAENLTKKQAKEKIENLGIPERLLERNVDYLSNVQFKILLEKLNQTSP